MSNPNPNPIAAKYLEDSVVLCREILADYASFNSRASFDAASVVDLAESIARNTQLQNVVVDQIVDPALLSQGYRYQLRAGFRRFKAIAELLKRDTIKAGIYAPLTPDEALAINYIENDARKDLSFHEEALVVDRFQKQGCVGPMQIGAYMTKTHEWVRLRLLYLALPPEIQEAVQRSEVTQNHLRTIGKINKESPEKALEYFRTIRRSNKSLLTRQLKDDTVVDVKQNMAPSRQARIKSNAAIRSVFVTMLRLYSEDSPLVVLLKWIMCEATDQELKDVALSLYEGNMEEFRQIWIIGANDVESALAAPAPTPPPTVDPLDCDHAKARAISEDDGRYRGVCDTCGKRASATGLTPSDAVILLDL